MSSSSFIARWLYRALLGAAFGRVGWKEFWVRVPIYPPPKYRALEINGLMNIIKTSYLEPMKEQLEQPSPFFTALNEEMDHQVDSMRYMLNRPFGTYKAPPISWKRKHYNRLKYKLKRKIPVLTTRGAIEDKEYDY